MTAASDPSIATKIQHVDQGDSLVVKSGGVINIESGGALKVAGVDVTTAVATGGVAGVAAGYKIARGSTSVTGATGGDINTGLATVLGVAASIGADISLNANEVSAALSATPGHITVKVWKPTATGDCTPIASTTATVINWVAVGT
jgi:hypothetical protein